MNISPTSQRLAILAILLGSTSTVLGQAPHDGGNQQTLQTTDRVLPDTNTPPGNVFLVGQSLRITIPDEAGAATRWRLTDDLEGEVIEGVIADRNASSISIANLPVGWYRISWLDAANSELAWTTAAVLAPLSVPTPQDSPICVDSATAWFARDDVAHQEGLSQLAALAGVNWVRDRMRWRDLQPAPDQLLNDTTYDSSASIQHRHGLKVLQVFHDTPKWAAAGQRATGRFPPDLRHVYHFARSMSERYHGRVQAWEPWNEANVATFGGHTIDEICAYQKAAYLGFKAGDPEVTVCWNATTAVPTERQTDGVLRNETWSYFDTYNIHTYDWADEYERLWKPARRAACGKPLWITESDRGMTFAEDSVTQDLSPANQRLKAQYVTQSYVKSLHAGAVRHFHFILGQYKEGKTQFGLLRHDMTPRPGYVALATLGRLLAGARCLGRLQSADVPDLQAFAFRAYPQGIERDVLVVWAERNVDWPDRGKTSLRWSLPESLAVEQAYDYLGRTLPVQDEYLLTSAPRFLLLAKGGCGALALTQPDAAPRRTDAPTSVVMQCVMPQASSVDIKRIPWASEYEHSVAPDTPTPVSLFVYNFGPQAVSGTIRAAQLPTECQVAPHQWQVTLQPMQRQELVASFTISQEMTSTTDDMWIELRGDFGTAGQPVIAFRLIAE